MQNRWDMPWVASRPDNNMRIGDAERNEVSELLSKHFSDGRLDAAEFQERLDRAMSAKTRADLSGLLTDLPRLQTPEQAAAVQVPPPPRQRPRLLRLALFTFVAIWVLSVVSAAGRWILWPGGFVNHVPWLLIGLIVFFVWARERRHRRWM